MFVEKYGWSEVGEKCYRTQFVIHNKHYSAIAAYTTRGFIAWEIFEGSVGAAEFMYFINHSVRPKLSAVSFAIIDNCAIHKTDEALECLENAFSGLIYSILFYMFSFFTLLMLSFVISGKFECCAPYSPDLKPVERGFKLVKGWLKHNEDFAQQDPIGAINHAFRLFSPDGEYGHHCKSIFTPYMYRLCVKIGRNHFSKYFANHRQWQQDVETSMDSMA